MDDGAVSLGRWHRLAPRGGTGLSCDADGVALGPVHLIGRTGSVNGEARYTTRPSVEIARALGLAYRDMSDAELSRCLVGLDRIAKAFNRSDRSLAAIMAVQLRLPEIDALGMAKLAAAAELHKYSPDQPRVPAGNRDGGQWTSAGETAGAELAQATGDERVHLPAGERNDELADLLEWIANAKPEDRPAIHAEIKRLYWSVGDVVGGGAMEQALGDAMDATSRADRERILRDFEYYTHGDPADVGQIRTGLTVGALVMPPGGAAEAIAPRAAETAAETAEGASEVWELGWAARGRRIESALGADLPPTFPVIDSFTADGIATSIKSIDLNSAIYQDAGRLSARINAYVDQLAEFRGAQLGKVKIEVGDIRSRFLNIAIPRNSGSAMQKAVIGAVKQRAKILGINLVITPF